MLIYNSLFIYTLPTSKLPPRSAGLVLPHSRKELHGSTLYKCTARQCTYEILMDGWMDGEFPSGYDITNNAS